MESETRDFADRMRWVMQLYRLSKKEIAKQCGIPSSTFNRYIDNGTQPTVKNLERIASTFSQLNIEWLVMGKGDAVKQAPSDDILRERYAFALEKIKILEDNIRLYKLIIEDGNKRN